MTLVMEDGTGLANATSYADVAAGDDYHSAHLYASTWSAATSGNKGSALMMATRLIDASYQFNGRKVSATQALQWPRTRCPDPDRDSFQTGVLSGNRGVYFDEDAVPPAVIAATCELARTLLQADSTNEIDGKGISQMSITGALHIQFDKKDAEPLIPDSVQIYLVKLGTFLAGRSSTVPVMRV